MAIPKNKINISHFWFHMMVALITDAILFGLVAIVFFFAGVKGIGLFVLAGLFLFEGILYSLLSGIIAHRLHGTELSFRIIGWGPGRLLGLFTGGILGARLAGVIGGMVGAIVLLFLGRWAGSKLGTLIGKYLEQFFHLGHPKDMSGFPAILRKKEPYIIYSVSVPTILFGCSLLFSNYDLVFLSHLKILIYARIIVVVYSLLTIGFQWLSGKIFFPHLRTNKTALPMNTQTLSFFIGFIFSIIPGFAGFILFFFGASLVELSVYCLASLISGLLWIIYRFPSYPKTQELDIPTEEKIIQ